MKSLRSMKKVSLNFRAKIRMNFNNMSSNIIQTSTNVYLISDPTGWWRGKNSKGETGLFPGNYVEKFVSFFIIRKIVIARFHENIITITITTT